MNSASPGVPRGISNSAVATARDQFALGFSGCKIERHLRPVRLLLAGGGVVHLENELRAQGRNLRSPSGERAASVPGTSPQKARCPVVLTRLQVPQRLGITDEHQAVVDGLGVAGANRMPRRCPPSPGEVTVKTW